MSDLDYEVLDMKERVIRALESMSADSRDLADRLRRNEEPQRSLRPHEKQLIRSAAIPAIQEVYEVAMTRYLVGNGTSGFEEFQHALLEVD